MSSSPTPFTLRPLISSDIPTCAHIAGLAFQSDRQTQFKAADPKNPYDHTEGMKAGLEHWLSRTPGSIELTVALDDTSQEIVGWVAWGFRGFDSNDSTPELNVESVSNERLPPPDTRPHMGSEKSAREQLDVYTSTDLSNFMAQLMPPGSKCTYIVSIVVHPSHQGKGVGSALIRKGTDRADDLRAGSWVHASEAGGTVFEKGGFREIRKLEVDLNEWNIEGAVPPEGEGGSWGKYVFRYMFREPVRH